MNKAKGLGFNNEFCKSYLDFLKHLKETNKEYKDFTYEEIEKDFLEPCICKVKESNWELTEREILLMTYISVKQTLMLGGIIND